MKIFVYDLKELNIYLLCITNIQRRPNNSPVFFWYTTPLEIAIYEYVSLYKLSMSSIN